MYVFLCAAFGVTNDDDDKTKICTESTDGNFGTLAKVVILIPTVTCTLPIHIYIFGIHVFPFPWDSHGNAMRKRNSIPMNISKCAESVGKEIVTDS